MKERIASILQEIRHWLPQQGPIGVFIHHNTLHALEDTRFEDAVEHASRIKGTEPYLPHARYLAKWRNGRISDAEVSALIPESRAPLWKALLEIDVRHWSDASVIWLRGEKGWAPDESLWEAVRAVRRPVPVPFEVAKSPTPEVDEEIIAFISSYMDWGLSYWPLPDRNGGILAAFRDLKKIKDSSDAHQIILNSLVALNIVEADWERFLREELLALAGWAGMVDYFEHHPAEARGSFSLVEFLAVRLLLRAAKPRNNEPVEEKPRAGLALCLERYLVCEKLGVPPSEVDWDEVERFDPIQRRRLLHQAYENTFYSQVLGALAGHRAGGPRTPKKSTPDFQVFTCIDDREESLRRHLEEAGGEAVETFAIAGFYNVDMFYQAMGERPFPHCPVILTPRFKITEQPISEHEGSARHWHRVHGTHQKAARYLHDHSRGTLTGMVVCAGTGFVASVPLVARVLFPRHSLRLWRKMGNLLHPTIATKLRIERTEDVPAREGIFEGYTVDEMTDRVAGILKATGFTKNFSRLVFILGHGSNSLNNPHESAYECGACGGHRGAPNARAFAQMANHPKVRARLAERGLVLPATTLFVGGYHDTCSDAIPFFDLDVVPASHRAELARARAIFNEARVRDAHERSRRFDNARHLSPKRALLHVEARCQSLSEPRPEYCHASNAICIVGRRNVTRGLFLDRRAFLSSYDAAQDPDGTILAGILSAVFPVCAGISLEYYFSSVDNEGYGCGTKLPHNITGLVGVMNGSASDLRTGLSSQMVEIHEPMRLLFVIEAPRGHLEKLMNANEGVRRLVVNGWVKLVLMDYETGKLTRFEEGTFVPYDPPPTKLDEYPNSKSYYAKKAMHLAPAKVGTLGVAHA